MILSDLKILQEIQNRTIVIDPFRREALGSNSYDVRLGKTLATYISTPLDARKETPLRYFEIPDSGFLLEPNQLYLGVTEEYTETLAHVPFLEGKSSAGRLGIDIHATAGKGDVGFCNHWTLELSCRVPVRIYAGMPIAQLIYFEIEGPVATSYSQKPTAKYRERSDRPMGSQMWRNLNPRKS